MQEIKSIRIISGRSPLSKQMNRAQQQEIFSFSKKQKRAIQQHPSKKLSKQREQINDLQRMIKGMLKKCQTQSRQRMVLEQQQNEWIKAKKKNEEYKNQLLQLKQLMKNLLFQREKSNAFQIYDF